LIEWATTYKGSSWSGRYIELLGETVDFPVFARELSSRQGELVPLSKVLTVRQKALLIGEAGSGKTTSLLQGVVVAARRLLAGESASVPVYVELNTWTEAVDLYGLIAASLASHGRPIDNESLRTYLAEGRFHIFFDGLNEIPSSRRTKGADQDLATFTKAYPYNPTSVSTRTVGYNAALFGDWVSYMVQPLHRDLIREFAIQYLGPRSGTELFTRLGGHNAKLWAMPYNLSGLAKNPLHLWMLTETFRRLGEIPRDRGSLFRLYVDFMLDQREEGKASRYPAYIKHSILRELARSMLQDGHRSVTQGVSRVLRNRCGSRPRVNRALGDIG